MTEHIQYRGIAYDGNAALKMAPAESPPPPKAPAQKPKQKQKAGRKLKTKSKSTTQPTIRIRQSWTTAPKAVICILVVAAVVIVTLASYANLVIINDQRVSLRGELDTLKTEETKLMAQYELAYDLQEIENQMISSGQMTKIQNWQTYTLELSEPDAVEYYQESDLKENVVSFAKNLRAAVEEYF